MNKPNLHLRGRNHLISVVIVFFSLLVCFPESALAHYAVPAVPFEQISSIENENIFLLFDFSHGITIKRIYDKVTQHDYLPQPTSLFEFAVTSKYSGIPYEGKSYQSDTGVNTPSFSKQGNVLTIMARAKEVPITFFLTITAEPGSPAAIVQTKVFYEKGQNPASLRMVMPKLRDLSLLEIQMRRWV